MSRICMDYLDLLVESNEHRLALANSNSKLITAKQSYNKSNCIIDLVKGENIAFNREVNNVGREL